MPSGKKRVRLVMPCLVCECEVDVSSKRYLELKKMNALPICRTNGCYRYHRRASGKVANGVDRVFYRKKRRANGEEIPSLASVRLSRDFACGLVGGPDSE